MAKRGRKPKAYVTSWGQTIPELTKDRDGRWRIIPTGQRFSEPDERVAIARLRTWIRQNAPEPTFVGVDPVELTPAQRRTFSPRDDGLAIRGHGDGTVSVGMELPPAVVWAYVRQELLRDPIAVAEHTGIPQLANLASMDLPKPSIKLSTVVGCYRNQSDAEPASKQAAIKALEQLCEFAQAKTLSDLSTPALVRYKDHLHKSGFRPGTIGAYFARCRYVIAHAKEWGHDTRQIDDCLSRMAVLKAPKNTAECDPTPIEPEDLTLLLRHANDFWTAALLCGVNCAMYVSEVMTMKRDEIDREKRTYLSRRGKTRVRRAAVLWPVTLEALAKVPQRGRSPWVFTSSHGKHFHPKSRWRPFDRLRRAAGVPHVTFEMLRDAGYSAAFGADTVELKMSKVLAGHTVDGDTDKYVRRKPEWTKPACDAIWAVYGDAITKGLAARPTSAEAVSRQSGDPQEVC